MTVAYQPVYQMRSSFVFIIERNWQMLLVADRLSAVMNINYRPTWLDIAVTFLLTREILRCIVTVRIG